MLTDILLALGVVCVVVVIEGLEEHDTRFPATVILPCIGKAKDVETVLRKLALVGNRRVDRAAALRASRPALRVSQLALRAS